MELSYRISQNNKIEYVHFLGDIMVNLPENVMKVINDPKSTKVLCTKMSSDGCSHPVQLGSLAAPAPNMIICAAILMKRTSNNLSDMMKGNEPASILVCQRSESYGIKVSIKEFLTKGPMFEGMNKRLAEMKIPPARGVWVMEPMEVWNQGPNMQAGTKIC